MRGDRLRRTLYKLVSRADDAGLSALTVVRARAFLDVFPTYGPAWHRLGQALGAIAHYEEAQQALQKAIEHCPTEQLGLPYAAMGCLFRESGDYNRAAEWFHRAIEAAPDDCIGHIHLGGLLARQGRLVEAEEVHRAGTRCTDGCVEEAFLNLGLVLRARGRFTEAAECFEEALRRDPDYRDAKRALRDVTACIRHGEDPLGRGLTGPSP
jgi:tetratricopeptide (TPR) repeat protein